MKKSLLLLLAWFYSGALHAAKVGVLIVATGRYIQFVGPLIDSAKEHFCTNHNVTYFVFTDGELPKAENVKKIDQKRLGWPYDTMMRLSMYNAQREMLKEQDYLFALDADMLFVDAVGDEILSDRVATQHPGFVGRRGTYERRKISTAYVAKSEGLRYFAGGFNGGSSAEFLKLAQTVAENIEKDLAKNVIAIWHDESHINRYFINNPPTKILDPSYCYPESSRLPYKKRLLALDKNHRRLRQ